MTVRVPHFRINALRGSARLKINDNWRKQVCGRILFMNRDECEHRGFVADKRLRNEAKQFKIGRGELRLVTRTDHTNRQRGKAKRRRLQTLQEYQRMMDGLLNDDEPPLRFEAGQPFGKGEDFCHASPVSRSTASSFSLRIAR